MPHLAGELIDKMKVLDGVSCDLIQAYAFLGPTTFFIPPQTGIRDSDTEANRNPDILFPSTILNSMSYEFLEAYL